MRNKNIILCACICFLVISSEIGGVLFAKVYENMNRDNIKILTVGSGGEYSTIQAAVDDAKDNDIIFIYPGEYAEAVDVTDKTVSIIGRSKDECILKYPNGNYYSPPLEMGSGMLANMTIYAEKQKQMNEVGKAYSLHIDFDISSNRSLHIRNVNFINDDYQVVGIGLRERFMLEFSNCKLFVKGIVMRFIVMMTLVQNRR